MELRNKELARRLNDGLVSPEELKDYLVRNYSVFELADELAGYLIEDILCESNRVILTATQAQLMERMFSKLVRLKRTDVGRKARTEKYLRQNRGVDESLFRDSDQTIK